MGPRSVKGFLVEEQHKFELLQQDELLLERRVEVDAHTTCKQQINWLHSGLQAEQASTQFQCLQV